MGDMRGNPNTRRTLIISLWLITGLGIGAVVGWLLGDMALWLIIGALAGLGLGLLLGSRAV
ncbi:MAG: hypothetical protein GX552_15060 [Chloroflexi bacterium]|jgi:F0F1-type ATP synthase assembly protein I|nr:hypothetical protein [Chloroflexota bacterium]